MRLLFFFTLLMFVGCTLKIQPTKVSGVDVVFKTKKIKFNDKAFLQEYNDHIQLQAYNAANALVRLDVYDTKICQGLLCQESTSFNAEHFGLGYEPNFLHQLLQKALSEEVVYEDNVNGITIEISKEGL